MWLAGRLGGASSQLPISAYKGAPKNAPLQKGVSTDMHVRRAKEVARSSPSNDRNRKTHEANPSDSFWPVREDGEGLIASAPALSPGSSQFGEIALVAEKIISPVRRKVLGT